MNITPINQALVDAGFVSKPVQPMPIQHALIEAGFIVYWHEPLTTREHFLVNRYRLQLIVKSAELIRQKKLGREFAERMQEFLNNLQKGKQD